MSADIRIIGAGAGTGKTHKLCGIISDALANGMCGPGGFIATTFTRKAASELTERVRAALLERNLENAALRVEEALVGTVHSVCSRILERFAFEAGISPSLRMLDEEVAGVLLAESIEECFSVADISGMERLLRRLGQSDIQTFSSKWKGQVRAVIEAARSNAIPPAALAGMAERNVTELLGQLPPATDDNLESALITAIETTLGLVSTDDDQTKKTAEGVAFLTKAAESLRHGDLAWSDWCKLAKLELAKASQPDALPVIEAASRVEEHPGLIDDIREYITRIFKLAGNTLEIYQNRKKVRGMLDYTDLEVLTLGVLEMEHVRECLAGEYGLLVVDEFQDTSPIQLQLFLKLAGLVKTTHWVGDIKQAIYGFRGCDPALMQAAEKKFRTGHKTEVLKTSRRHRPQLVDFFNKLFPDVFARTSDIKRTEVELHAHRTEHPSFTPAIELWRVSNGKMLKAGGPAAVRSAEVESCIVRGIRELMDEGIKVGCKGQGSGKNEQVRPLRWRDIAVLCRTNGHATSLAARLQAAGIPVARRTHGLMSTPEAVLALACLRWLGDERDSVAVAEILTLESGRGTGDWLASRLTWLQEHSKQDRWGIDGEPASDLLRRIDRLRGGMKLQTPAELLDAVIAHGDLAGIASQWDPGRADKRRANLEALRGHAAEYENSCTTEGSPASHSGFLAWCDELAQDGGDQGALDESADNVQVMTWHGSKGLEWPVVICMDLPDPPRARIWNSPLVVSPTQFHPDNPLAGRWIRFWPYPFGMQESRVPLFDKVLGSSEGQLAAADAAAELARLRYVVMTRARDYLVLPTDLKKDPWLPDGMECPLLAIPHGKPATDKVKGIPRRIRYLVSGEDEVESTAETSVMWHAQPMDPAVFPPSDLTPSSLPPLASMTTGEELAYGHRINIPPGTDESSVGNALHAVLAAYLVDPEIPDFAEKITKILAAHGISADAGEVADSVTAFHRLLLSRFNPTDILVEVPFTSRNSDGQRITGFIDLVLLTAEGAVLIDHKSYPGGGLAERAGTYSGQLAAYRHAIESAGHHVTSCWIHWCTQGVLHACD